MARTPATSEEWAVESRRFADAAAERLGLSRAARDLLHPSVRKLQVQIRCAATDGARHIFGGYRIQHSNLRGPFKGGVRFSPGVDLEESRALAALQRHLPERGAGESYRKPVRQRGLLTVASPF